MIIAGFDVESTGLDVTKDRICEIALIAQDFDTGEQKFRYVSLINPTIAISKGAANIHGIMDSDVIGKSTFADIAPTLAKVLSFVDILVAHNGEEFDGPILINELIRSGVTITKLPTLYDTMLNGRWATSDGKLPTLGELCWATDVPYDLDEAHSASYDVEVMLKAFHNGLQWGFFNDPRKP